MFSVSNGSAEAGLRIGNGVRQPGEAETERGPAGPVAKPRHCPGCRLSRWLADRGAGAVERGGTNLAANF